MPWLINASQLDKFRKSQKNLIILDATMHQNAKQEFIEKHIIEAQFLPLDELHDPNADLKNTLIKDEKAIGEKLSKLGIRNDYKIILYDNSSMHTSCRALWCFKYFGHNPHLLYILDGGLAAWERYGGKIESGEVNFSAKSYEVHYQPTWLRTLDDIKNNLKEKKEQIVDVRHPVRFSGGPEDRPNLRSGHIPGSFNLPFSVLFEKDGTFLPLDKIKKKLIDMGVSLTAAPIITSCGSGTTAPILNFILDLMSVPNSLYNGSWSEYGAEKLYPGEHSLDERPVDTCID